VAGDSPPSLPLVAIERTKTPSSPMWSCILIRSPSSAPPVIGLDGSTATTPTRLEFVRNEVIMALARVDLPTPGGPVMPTMGTDGSRSI
jgi:hypothetical protein